MGEVQSQIDEIDRKIKEAEQGAAQRAADLHRLDKELKALQAKTEKLDTERKFKKAELDSLRSLYDGMIERDEEREAQRLPEHDRRQGRAAAPCADARARGVARPSSS